MRPARATVGLIAFGTLAAMAAAVPAVATPARPIRFDRLSLEQGLSQSTVQDVLQDRRGYIWLATEEGLNRFDGISFKVYKRDPATRPPFPAASCGTSRRTRPAISGSLPPAGSRCGRGRPSGSSGRRSWPTEHPRPSLRAGTECALDRHARRRPRAPRLRDPGLHPVHPRPSDAGSLGDDRIYALHIDAKDRLWVGTDRGLDRLEAASGKFTHFTNVAGNARASATTRSGRCSRTAWARCGWARRRAA